MYDFFLLAVYLGSRVVCIFATRFLDMRANYFKSLLVTCLVLLRAAGGSTSGGDAVHLVPRTESTEDIIQAVAGNAMPMFGPRGASTVERDYAEAKRRMLDAEEVAIKRIVRKVFSN